ncbi:MAG: hypothetical protein ACJ76Z_16110 [Thermoleophilaceae bacterium]
MSAPLDDWLPQHNIRLRHARVARASPDDLWQAAVELRISDTPTMRRLIGWRLGPHTPSADTTYRELFRSGVFTLLEEGERFSVSGLAGRIWTPSGDYANFETPADYREYAVPGTAKVAVMTAVREHDRGSEIVSESRVRVHGRRTRVVFRGFWAFIRPFSRFVPTEVLAAAVRRAEA